MFECCRKKSQLWILITKFIVLFMGVETFYVGSVCNFIRYLGGILDLWTILGFHVLFWQLNWGRSFQTNHLLTAYIGDSVLMRILQHWFKYVFKLFATIHSGTDFLKWFSFLLYTQMYNTTVRCYIALCHVLSCNPINFLEGKQPQSN